MRWLTDLLLVALNPRCCEQAQVGSLLRNAPWLLGGDVSSMEAVVAVLKARGVTNMNVVVRAFPQVAMIVPLEPKKTSAAISPLWLSLLCLGA